MHVDVVNSVVINRPVAEVSQYAADPHNAPLWYENIKSVEWKTPPPATVGSRIDFVAEFLGRRLAYTYEFVEFVPGTRNAIGDADAGATLRDGDNLHLGRRERRYANDASEPWHAERIRRMARTADVVHGWKGKQKGSGVAQETP